MSPCSHEAPSAQDASEVLRVTQNRAADVRICYSPLHSPSSHLTRGQSAADQLVLMGKHAPSKSISNIEYLSFCQRRTSFNAITLGHLGAGSRLPTEAQLAEEFGVSRNTVREALRPLEAQGLIIKKAGAQRGSFVRSVSAESLSEELRRLMQQLLSLGRISHDEIAEVCRHLEGPAIRLAAQNRTEIQLAQMWAIVRGENQRSLDGATYSLHGMIAEASGNALFSALSLPCCSEAMT